MPRARGTNTRTDTMTPKLPAGTTAPGQAYGNRTAQAQSMEMLPLGGPSPTPAGAPSGPGPVPAGAPGTAAPPAAPPPPDAGRILAGNQSGVLPGSLDWKNKPGAHPLTHGLPNGPGAGPEALGAAGDNIQAQANESGSLQQLLGHLASQPGSSSVIKALAGRAGSAV